MTVPVLFVAGGAALLYGGAEALIRGATTLGRRFGVSSIIIGLTVVSVGTSAPELVVSLLAAIGGNPDIAVGNVLGSNLANVGLILAIAAMIRPLEMAGPVLRRDIPWMLGVTVLVLPLLWNLELARIEGAVLALALLAYLRSLAKATRRRRREGAEGEPAEAGGAHAAEGSRASADPAEASLASPDSAGASPASPDPGDRSPAAPVGVLLPVLGVVLGAVGLALGGNAVVRGATELARELGIPELLVGLSVVAVGTSLPELAAVIVAAIRKEADLAVGNIVGSNLFNLSFVLGTTALVTPIPIPPQVLRVEYPVVLLLSLALLPLAITQRQMGRLEGALLLAAYVAAWGWILVAG